MNLERVLILGLNWPEPRATAAGTRMMQLVHWFLEKEFQITFASTATINDYSANLTALGIEQRPIKLNDPGFDEFVLNLNPQIVVFDRFVMEEQFGWRVSECVPKAIRILDTEDLHSLRSYRQKTDFKDNETDLGDWLGLDITKRELASIYRSDLSLIISEFEIQLLRDTLKVDQNLLFYLPFMMDKLTEKTCQKWLAFDKRQHFIFVGNGKHAPNLDAISWLNTTIWPKIRESLPESELHIYGPYLPERILNMENSKTGFRIKGWVNDLGSVMSEAKVNLAPLRFGAGIKGKILDGFKNGTPTISTSIGMEGIGREDQSKSLIQDDSIGFTNLAIEIYSDQLKWEKARTLGKNLVNEYFSKETFSGLLKNKIIELEKNLDRHRASNIIGTILSHHTLQSTKYLSKWIEAKNKA
ncbi:glycosyltransferase family 4 protein [uncultured Eudoraea sp.]|uniref:glycosyltransferase n=1 Tax=uncultured Eudoraea sp. TaxID=1035614 RepID=UPI0026171F82|nr:glycosyltransferase family 4 protein [uncultured Eudoraea sp.]